MNKEELETKSVLARETFQEVQDAAKHQDEKIGRLLVSIAFLTASALALANLGHGHFVGMHFNVGIELQLALICISAFVILVLAAVCLLIMALGSPLNLPDAENRASPPSPNHLFFYAIARQNMPAWRALWKVTKARDLALRRLDVYVEDSHHLSIRARYKYDLRTEATALLSLSLLALVLGVLFICFILEPPSFEPRPTETALVPYQRVFISLAFGIYTLIELLGHSRFPTKRGDPERIGWLGVVAVPGFISLLVLYPQPWLSFSMWIFLIVACAIATTVMLYRKRNLNPLLFGPMTALTWLIVGGAWIAASRGEYWGQLLAAVVAVMTATLGTYLFPILRARYQDWQARKKDQNGSPNGYANAASFDAPGEAELAPKSPEAAEHTSPRPEPPSPTTPKITGAANWD